MATGVMLPLVRAIDGSSSPLLEAQNAATTPSGAAAVVNATSPPPYPGALVGFWCAPKEPSWVLEILSGWLEATITVAYEPTTKAPDSGLSSIEVLLDGKPAGRLQPLLASPLLAGWCSVGYVPQGPHHFALSADPGLKLVGAWVTNGLLSFWPGDPLVLAADEKVWPGNLRVVPRPVEADLPLEFGHQGLASHINQQGIMGIADSTMTTVARSLRLRYSDAELNLMLNTNDGLRRVKDLCPDFHFTLLDGFLPCPIANFTYDGIRYAITFAAVPEAGEAVDLVHVAARNESAEPRASRVRLLLDASADVTVQSTTAVASREVIAYFGGSARARTATRPLGYLDPRAQTEGVFLAPILDPPKMEWDPSLFSGRISWGKQPVIYSLRCPPGEHYTIYLGIIKLPRLGQTWVSGPNHKQVSLLAVDGAQEQRVDANKLEAPAVFRFDASDANHDGLIEIRSTPPADLDGAVSSLSAIWVFPAGASIDKDLLLRGKLPDTPLHHADVGGSAVSWYIDLFPNEDWSSAYVDISSERVIPPGANDEFWAALPVNHRGAVFPYGGARRWSEADESTPAYRARVQTRLAAAHSAAESPSKAWDKVRAYWAAQLQSRTRLTVPEDTVADLVRTSHCYFRILRFPVRSNCAVPMGGDGLEYYDFSERDSAYSLVGLNATGRHDLAEPFLNIYLARSSELPPTRWPLGQDDQGKWMTRGREEDTQGFVLWALGEHYMLSQDKVWLVRAWPWMKRGLEYIRRTRAAAIASIPDPNDPRHGLWIPGAGEMASDEPSYWYWYNYFIETGLRFGVVEAEAMGEQDYARALREEHADFVQCLRRSMRKRFLRLDYRRGILPLRANGHQTLDVMLSEGCLFPSHSLEPYDPMVTLSLGYIDTFAGARAGSFPITDAYGSNGRGIWPSLTADYAMMHLRRGEPEKVVDCFYTLLSTCGRTNSWGEVMTWDNGFSTGGQPYMWANGVFLILLRNMLLHEAGEWFAASPAGPRELWICPATPRKWMHQPGGMVVERAPSYFGPVTFSMRMQERGEATATIEFEGQERLPDRLVVHIRSLRDRPLQHVTVNGKNHPYFAGEQVIIAKPPRKLEIVC
jgi:hypothetical protein